jgi:3-phosphoshikimate 1-carboxyvinyltransferase
MSNITIHKTKSLKGEITPPPDKSITHRAIMFASIAEGKSIIRNPLMAEDPISTMNAMRALGVEITEVRDSNATLIIHGKGLHGLREPFDVINCGNSGTTARLISGILAGNPFFAVLTGDDSLRQRPMARVINPLKEMGAEIFARQNHRYLPMAIKGGGLKGITHNMPVASAQVKSSLILAGLYAEGITVIHEPQKSRDHTERLLKSMGAPIEVGDLEIKVKGLQPSASGGEVTVSLQPIDITIPSDFSSAAFFIVGALILPNSEILIKNVVLNPTRTGILEVIKDMGGEVKINNIREVSGEPVGEIYVKSAKKLKGVRINKEIMPSMIDEFPILCVLATQAEGVTEISGAEELRVKESDRIRAMATELKKMNVELEEHPDGIAIKGKAKLKGANVDSYHDHRIAMSLSIAGLVAEGITTIENSDCVAISFPNFYEELERLNR